MMAYKSGWTTGIGALLLLLLMGTTGAAAQQRVATYDSYDQWGNLTQATDANGQVIHYYYGSNASPMSQSGIFGTQGTYLTGIRREGSPDLGTKGYYDNKGRLKQTDDPAGVSAFYEYDALNRLERVKNDAGVITQAFTYNVMGSGISSSNPNSIRTRSYLSGPDRYSTEYIDGLGRTIQTHQRTGVYDIITALTYDGQGRPQRSYKPYKEDVNHTYDPNFVNNADSYYGDLDNGFPYMKTEYEESPLNRPFKAIPEGGEVAQGAVTMSYRVKSWNNDNYQVTTTTDESNKTTETWTDGWGRTVRTVAEPGGIAAETTFEYDALHNLTNVTAPNGTETTYQYNAKGELTQKTSPDAGTVKYKYDAAGNLRFMQDANRATAGEVVFYSYDIRGRKKFEGVISANFNNLNPNQTYSFEGYQYTGMWVYDLGPPPGYHPWSLFAGRINTTTQTNLEGKLSARIWKVGTGASTSSNPWRLTMFSYDSDGRLADKWIWTGNKSSWAMHLSYQYNRQGERTRRMISGAGATLYLHTTYNQRGLVIGVYLSGNGTLPSTPEAAYSYTASGTIANINYRGSKDAAYGYTIRDWVKTINDVGSPGGNFAALYDYYDNGTVEQADFYNPDTGPGGQGRYWYDFSYDGLNRLSRADYDYPGFVDSGKHRYDLRSLAYDAAGNITRLIRWDETDNAIDNLTYSYTGSNHLQSITDTINPSSEDWDAENATFSYDPVGNMTSQTSKFSTIAYDHRNLPVEFTTVAGPDVKAFYDAGGQRVLKETTTGAYRFYVKDGAETVAVIDENGLSHVNLSGPNGVFGRWKPGNDFRYYLHDHLGSTRAVTDQSGAILETFDYYPFGLLMPKRSSTTGNTIEKFTGKERDESIGLDYFGARYYDPALGRWHNPDPLASERPSLTPYNYVRNNPLAFIDPDGLLDDYAFDTETGQLSLLEETEDDFDVIYTGNFKEDGTFAKDGESIEISKGTLQGKFFDDISESGLVFRDLKEGLQTMKFLSFSSEKEFSAWAFTNSAEEGLSVSPWVSNTYRLSKDYYAKKDRVGYLGKKKFSIHTHSSTREGYGYGWPSPGDIEASKLNPQHPHYILSRRQDITRYYPNGNTFSVTDLNRYFK